MLKLIIMSLTCHCVFACQFTCNVNFLTMIMSFKAWQMLTIFLVFGKFSVSTEWGDRTSRCNMKTILGYKLVCMIIVAGVLYCLFCSFSFRSQLMFLLESIITLFRLQHLWKRMWMPKFQTTQTFRRSYFVSFTMSLYM